MVAWVFHSSHCFSPEYLLSLLSGGLRYIFKFSTRLVTQFSCCRMLSISDLKRSVLWPSFASQSWVLPSLGCITASAKIFYALLLYVAFGGVGKLLLGHHCTAHRWVTVVAVGQSTRGWKR
mmetsp:Transcript_16772/g.46421  ORF Transcript_16772/g.46421 Transcript_16772/m.46421 type:complete len:121 (+) Transcript_16772:177-539(+)